jgi:hypothetical protein
MAASESAARAHSASVRLSLWWALRARVCSSWVPLRKSWAIFGRIATAPPVTMDATIVPAAPVAIETSSGSSMFRFPRVTRAT